LPIKLRKLRQITKASVPLAGDEFLMMLKILDFPVVLFGSFERIERAQIFSLPGFRVNFAGIDAVLARF
jgi:hypothetical protein